MGLDALIAIGGEDTLGVATRLGAGGVPIIGVPKTIDNDLNGTDYTFGFDTAVTIATEAIDRLHTTAESHHRVLIVEVMGRHSGWIAFHSGMAGGANVILIPERPFRIDEVCGFIERRFASQYAPIVVVAEGALPIEGTLPVRRDEVDGWLRAPDGHRDVPGGRDRPADRQRGPCHRLRPRATSAPPSPSTGSLLMRSGFTPLTPFTTGTRARWSPCMAPPSTSCR